MTGLELARVLGIPPVDAQGGFERRVDVRIDGSRRRERFGGAVGRALPRRFEGLSDADRVLERRLARLLHHHDLAVANAGNIDGIVALDGNPERILAPGYAGFAGVFFAGTEVEFSAPCSP